MSAVGPAPLYDSVGVVDFSTRGKLEITGDDRAKFLHNLCTNEIKSLATGTGCEAFLLDAKGHVQFYVLVHNLGDRLVLEELAPAGETSGSRLLKHLDKYLIREKVVLTDRTHEWGEIFVAGDGSAEVVARLLDITPPTAPLTNIACPSLGEGALVACSMQATAPNYTIFAPRESVIELQSKFATAGAVSCDEIDTRAPRIKAGLPLYGIDITDKNLAQEIDRIDRSINFNKGCYLGQETVARLDALGHVNKSLVTLEFAALPTGPAEPVAAGTELTLNGATVGQVTSSAMAPRGTVVALAYVKRGSGKLGAELQTSAGAAKVIGPLTSSV
jgi:folate-binding protein YgfZ